MKIHKHATCTYAPASKQSADEMEKPHTAYKKQHSRSIDHSVGRNVMKWKTEKEETEENPP